MMPSDILVENKCARRRNQRLIFPSNLPKSYLTSRNNPREAPMLGTTISHYRILEKIGEVRWGKCLAWRIPS